MKEPLKGIEAILRGGGGQIPRRLRIVLEELLVQSDDKARNNHQHFADVLERLYPHNYEAMLSAIDHLTVYHDSEFLRDARAETLKRALQRDNVVPLHFARS